MAKKKMTFNNPYEEIAKLYPTTLIATDETLRSVYARNAPDVPDWFQKNNSFEGERFLEWLEYYSDLMLKHFGK